MVDCKQVLSCFDETSYGEESKNVCRINVYTRSFDWLQPPNRNKGGSGTGTGFVLNSIFDLPETLKLSNIYIVTAHHVVANAVQIRVNFAKVSPEYYDVVLVGCNPDMDFALLELNGNDFRKKPPLDKKDSSESTIIGLRVGDSDEIQPPMTVTAHGFAFGKPHMQTTKGVVSGRIDSPSRLQIDVAVNPGNSGGPLLDGQHRVIGLVTSGRIDAQGINYVAPIKEAIIIGKRILAAWIEKKQPVFDRLPSLNCSFTKANRVLLKDKGQGVVCTSVHPLIGFPQTADDAVRNIKSKMDRAKAKAVAAARNGGGASPSLPLLGSSFDDMYFEKTLPKGSSHPPSSPQPQLSSSEAEDEEQVRKLRDLEMKIQSVVAEIRKQHDVGRRMDRNAWIEIVMRATSDLQLVATIVDLLRNDTLREGDIVVEMTVDGKDDKLKVDIDLQMTCNFPFWPSDRLGFQATLDRLACADGAGGAGDTVGFRVFRRTDESQELQQHEVSVRLLSHQNTFRRMFPDAESVDYMVMGGVFVMPFVQNHIPLFERQPLHILMGRPQTRHASILIITHIMPESPFNECESIGAGDVLVSVGASTVTNLHECRNAWQRETQNMDKDHAVTICMRDGTLASATVAQLEAASKHIMSEYDNASYIGYHSNSELSPPGSPRREKSVDEVSALQREIEALKIELAEAQTVNRDRPRSDDETLETDRASDSLRSPLFSDSDSEIASVSSTSLSDERDTASGSDIESDTMLQKTYEHIFGNPKEA